ncbi:TATA box-binding protein-associated factor RNA polymerase I subunit D [Leptodactylus fuscus]|uniref:TATA box-binding protein-associated factor RNA polymerase I subunit D n=1 Tax=Leptodactylus fuscus TaxID=238119 RepID=UPI003F4EDFB8
MDTGFSRRRCRARRTRTSKANPKSSLNSSSDDLSEFPNVNKEISDYFKNPYRRKWEKAKKKERRKKRLIENQKKKSKRAGKTKPLYSIPLQQRKRRRLHKGILFPVTSLKHLPLKRYFTYEQLVLGGFLNHVKDLKYEHKLKKSLKDLKVDEDLDHENIQMRTYSYLDDNGPLSPISEPGENLKEDEAEEEEVKVVENSTFVLDCQVPSKESWQIKKKRMKKKSACRKKLK